MPVCMNSVLARLGLFRGSYCPGFCVKRMGQSTGMSARIGLQITCGRSIDRSINQSFNQYCLPMSVKMNCQETATKIRTNLGIEWISGVGRAPAELVALEPPGGVVGGAPKHAES